MDTPGIHIQIYLCIYFYGRGAAAELVVEAMGALGGTLISRPLYRICTTNPNPGTFFATKFPQVFLV